MLTLLTTDILPWSAIFLVAMLATTAMAWLSHEGVKRRLAFVLFLAWISENFLHDRLGAESRPFIAMADLTLLVLVLAIGYRERSWTAFSVATLFAFDQAIVWGSMSSGSPPNGVLYATLNALYLLQLLIVGGASARVAWGALGLHRLPDRSLAAHREVRR